MMDVYAGMKRKSAFHSISMENPDGLDLDLDLLEPSKAKRTFRSQALRCIANGQSPPNNWNMGATDMDQSEESKMETNVLIAPSHHPNPRDFSFCAPAHSNPTSHFSGPSVSAFNNACLSMEYLNAQGVAQSTQTLLQCSNTGPDARSGMCLFPQSESTGSYAPIFFPAESRTAQRCPECAAGRSGHIRHIGRWRLMDSQ